jgi:hypothetical protein
MPGGDRTGPRGMGPMTGRGAGYCAGYATPGYVNPFPGRGMGRGGFGGGRGHRHWFYATGFPYWARYGGVPMAAPYGTAPYPNPMTSEQELDYLRNQAKSIEDSLADINQRIEELENEVKK